MECDTITRQLNAIFQDVFDDPLLQINVTMTAADVEGWDSLTHINLIVAVEKEFQIRLSTAEVKGLHNVGDLMELIQNKSTKCL